MSKHTYIAIFGFLTAVLPFLGLPYIFKKWGALIFGFLIVCLIMWIKWENKNRSSHRIAENERATEDVSGKEAGEDNFEVTNFEDE